MRCVNANLTPVLPLNGVFAQGSAVVCFDSTFASRSITVKASHVNAPDGALVSITIISSLTPGGIQTVGYGTVANGNRDMSLSTANGFPVPMFGSIGSIGINVAPDDVNFVTILAGIWRSGG